MTVVDSGWPERLASALEYNKWGDFYKVVWRTMIACENSGHIIVDDFPEVRKIVSAGATSKRIGRRQKSFSSAWGF